MHAELAAQGIHVGRKRVARLMRAAGVRGVSRRKWVTTTTRDPEARAAPDLVQRDFHVDGPDRLWVADITYVPTGAGFLYLAVVLDAWSRRVIGWAMATHLRTELVLAALDMALEQRRPHGVIHHSDQGCQYTSIAFGQRCLRVRRPAVDGLGRRRLRQCAVRELLRDPGVRAARSASGSGRRPRPPGGVRLHRGLVQSAAAPLGAGLRVAPALRANSCRRGPSSTGAGESEGRTASRSDVDRGGCYLGYQIGSTPNTRRSQCSPSLFAPWAWLPCCV